MEQTFKPTLVVTASQKGGVGKTTTAVSIAHKFARRGLKTLLIDLDPQGHCAISLGMNPEPALFDWLSIHYADSEVGAANAVRATGRPCLHLVPGDSRTHHAEYLMMSGRIDFRSKLDILQASMAAPPSVIVFDTAAGGAFQEIVMRLADYLIIPVRLETLGMDGVNATLGILAQLNSKAQVMVLPVMYDMRLGEHQYHLGLLKEKYVQPNQAVAEAVPARVAVAEAVACGQTIWEYESTGIVDVRAPYSRLVTWMVEGIKANHDR